MVDSFIERWMGKPGGGQALSTRTVKTDRWDEEDLTAVTEIMPGLRQAVDHLVDHTSTGKGAIADTFFSFFHSQSEPEDPSNIRPDYIINALVRDLLQDMTEWAELRALGTSGDMLNAAMAVVCMRHDLVTLFDKVKAEQELAEKLAQALQDLTDLIAEAQAIQGRIDEIDEQVGDGEPTDEQAAGRAAAVDDADANAAAQADLEALLQALGVELQEALAAKGYTIQRALRSGLVAARDNAQTMVDIDQSWSTEPGAMQKLGIEERLALAKRIKDNPLLLALSALIGPMKRVMFGEQRKQPSQARNEVYSIEYGDDLSRVVPEMLVNLSDPDLEMGFYRDLVQGSLMQYAMRGVERLGMGGIICCLDNSYSMKGKRELWGKAVAISLLHLARQQNRSFKGIHFSYPGSYKEYDFLKPADFDVDRIFDYAATFLAGGTDFQTPLAVAVSHLRAEYDATGAVRGDIVFITDGECEVTDKFLADFKAEEEELGFQTFGVLVGHEAWEKHDALKEICSGRIVIARDLDTPEDVREVFANIHSF